MISSARDVAGGVANLLSAPKISLAINRLMESDDAGIGEIANLIEIDPALCVALLRVSNSAAMNTGVEIDSIQKAVSRLGLNQVRQLVTGIESAKQFDKLPNTLWSMEDFWRHSLACAVIARQLARHIHFPDPDTAFTAGLLHDIGELVLFSVLPEESEACLEDALASDHPDCVFIAEETKFGFSHAEVGAELTKSWGIASSLIEAIEFHHHPETYIGQSILPALIHLSNSLAVLQELRSCDPEDAPTVVVNVMAEFKLDITALEEFLDKTRQETEELTTMLSH